MSRRGHFFGIRMCHFLKGELTSRHLVLFATLCAIIRQNGHNLAHLASFIMLVIGVRPFSSSFSCRPLFYSFSPFYPIFLSILSTSFCQPFSLCIYQWSHESALLLVRSFFFPHFWTNRTPCCLVFKTSKYKSPKWHMRSSVLPSAYFDINREKWAEKPHRHTLSTQSKWNEWKNKMDNRNKFL